MSRKLEKFLNETSVDWDKFQQMLNKHDWYYEMSDDFRRWQEGKDKAKKIRFFMENLSGDDYKKARYMYLKAMEDKRISMTKEAQSELRDLEKKFG